MLVKRSVDLKYSDVTPREIYLNRRKLLYGMGLAGGLALAGKSLANLVSPSVAGLRVHETFGSRLQVLSARRKR